MMHGRGRGIAGQMGRGRLMPNKQNLRVVECKPQPCVVSVEGLSSSTTDVQLKNLLMSVGPIQVDHPWLVFLVPKIFHPTKLNTSDGRNTMGGLLMVNCIYLKMLLPPSVSETKRLPDQRVAFSCCTVSRGHHHSSSCLLLQAGAPGHKMKKNILLKPSFGY